MNKESLTFNTLTFEEVQPQIGLVSAVVKNEQLVETALRYPRMMTAKSPGGLNPTKRGLEQNIDSPSLKTAIELENIKPDNFVVFR